MYEKEMQSVKAEENRNLRYSFINMAKGILSQSPLNVKMGFQSAVCILLSIYADTTM